MYQRIDDFVRKAQLVLAEQFLIEREEDFDLEKVEAMFDVRIVKDRVPISKCLSHINSVG